MSSQTSNARCPICERLETLCQQLQAQLAEQAGRIEELERKLAAATKNSSNSSKPPSSDIVKPVRPRKPAVKRKKGGQRGHQRIMRPAVAEDELDWLTQYSCEQCPCCGGPLTTDTENPVSRVQQLDIVSRTETTEHQSLASHCAACNCHASLSTIRKYLRDVYGLKLSRSLLAKVIGKISEAIAPLYEDLLGGLKIQRVLNIDETGHRDSGKRKRNLKSLQAQRFDSPALAASPP